MNRLHPNVKFQKAHGLPATGKADDATLKKRGVKLN